MKITIVVDDQRVIVDRVGLHMPDLDWSKFDGDPSSPLDDIAAVQFDTGHGQGHIEYREIITAQASRPNMRPPDWMINQAQFEAMFGWVLPLHAARKAEAEAGRAKAEADAEKARQVAIENPLPVNQSAPVDISQFEAALAEKDAKLADLEAKVNAMLQAAKDVGGEAA